MTETRNLSRATSQVPELAGRTAVTLDEEPPAEPCLEYEPDVAAPRRRPPSGETEQVPAVRIPLPPPWSAVPDRPVSRPRRWVGSLVILAMVATGLLALWCQQGR